MQTYLTEKTQNFNIFAKEISLRSIWMFEERFIRKNGNWMKAVGYLAVGDDGKKAKVAMILNYSDYFNLLR